MKTWKFDDHIVIEVEHDHDVHAFLIVTNTGERIIKIVPHDLEGCSHIRGSLNAGIDPIKDDWDNGLGYNVEMPEEAHHD